MVAECGLMPWCAALKARTLDHEPPFPHTKRRMVKLYVPPHWPWANSPFSGRKMKVVRRLEALSWRALDQSVATPGVTLHHLKADWKCRISDSLNQTLLFNKISRWFVWTMQAEEHRGLWGYLTGRKDKTYILFQRPKVRPPWRQSYKNWDLGF